MATIFSRIVAGEIPSHKVAEDDEFFAFLDINPVALGHTLVIPKKEVDYIFDIDDPMLGRMVAFAKRVARAQETAIECKRVGLAVMGLEVPSEKVMVNIERYGNTSAATLPLCIWDFEDKLKKGDNIIFTAFGAGFTWGAVYVKWGYDGKKES